MLESGTPFSRIADGPGLLWQRFTGLLFHLKPRDVDVDRLLHSIAVYDPDYFIYLNSEGILSFEDPRSAEEQARLS